MLGLEKCPSFGFAALYDGTRALATALMVIRCIHSLARVSDLTFVPVA